MCIVTPLCSQKTTALARVSRSFRKVFANMFAKFSQDVRGFRRFGNVFGPVWTFPDAFEHVPMRSEAFGSVRTFLDFFNLFRHFLLCFRACAKYRRSLWRSVSCDSADNLRNVRSQAWKQQLASPVKDMLWHKNFWNHQKMLSGQELLAKVLILTTFSKVLMSHHVL